MIKAFRYKLRTFGIEIDGSAGLFCDMESVTKNTRNPESILSKKLSIYELNSTKNNFSLSLLIILEQITIIDDDYCTLSMLGGCCNRNNQSCNRRYSNKSCRFIDKAMSKKEERI